MNQVLAQKVMEHLASAGVREVVVCPGSYNSPLISELESSEQFLLHYSFEERSASFFALGRIKASSLPVAVCVTSGTAVAECLPAVIEAKYSGLPLVILSGDRPARFVGTGAPQVLEQTELLSAFVSEVVDYAATEVELRPFQKTAPIHFNVRFEEPLYGDRSPENASAPLPSGTLSEILVKARRPLVLLSEIPQERQNEVEEFLLALGAPVLIEPLSQVRESPRLGNLRLAGGNYSLFSVKSDLILRIGAVPVSSLWRDVERSTALRAVPIVVCSDLPYTGIARLCAHFKLDEISGSIGKAPAWPELKERDTQIASKIETVLSQQPLSEPSIVRRLSEILPTGSNVYLGNSLPIREWSDFATYKPKQTRYFANRGQNGIDGQIASFAGIHSADGENWAVLGDLTFLYDISSLTLLARTPGKTRLVVINNAGGRIFERLPYFAQQFKGAPAERFVNAQQVSIADLARAFGLQHVCLKDCNFGELQDKAIIEVVVDNQQTNHAYEQFGKVARGEI